MPVIKSSGSENAKAGIGVSLIEKYNYDSNGNLKKKNPTAYDVATGNASIIDLAKGKAQSKK